MGAYDTNESGADVTGIGLDELNETLDTRLAEADALLLDQYPGERGQRQPAHTVYIPADRFHSGIAREWGERASRSLRDFAPDADALAAATGMDGDAVADSLPRVWEKLGTEPIEDVRIDLEDGYGTRSDAEEDRHVTAAADALCSDIASGDAPPYFGVRMKGMEAAGRRRGLRTLAMFLSALLDGAGGVPQGLVVTLPKITSVRQVEAMVWVTEELERRFGLAARSLGFELQIETPQSVMAPDGAAAVARMIHAGAGRVTALHYGTYDYSAACGVPAAHQSMAHPAADHAKAVMQVAAAGTGVWLSDGSTNVLPVGTAEQVHAAWRLHAGYVRRSLERGFHQGWDMHPHQLPTRFLGTYAFYREAFAPAAARLRAYLGANGDTDAGVADEPATAQALASTLVRGLRCGALARGEVAEATGVSAEVLTGFANRRVG